MKIPLLSNWFERRSNTLNRWLNWLDTLWAGQDSSTGVVVSDSTVMGASGVYACVRVLSQTMASLPLPVYKRLDNGGKRRAYTHPLYTLLHDAPNNYQTSFDFREMMMVHVLLYGNFYALVDRDPASGRVTSLIPFARPTDMEVGLFDGKYVRYLYRLQDGTTAPFDDRNILHVRGLSKNGLTGIYTLDAAKEPFGLTLALQQYAAKFFGNGARPGGVLEHPQKLTDDAQKRLRENWEKTYGGVSNAHKVAVLEEGMKFHEIGRTPEEAQSLESRKFQLEDVARIFGVPPHLIGHLERSTFNNIEHQSIEFVTHCVRPWAVRLEQRFTLTLFNASERQRYIVEFNLDGLLRGDFKTRQEGLATQRQNGIISANEWRALENMNPIDGEDGDAYLVNSTMIPVTQAMKAQPPNSGATRAVALKPVILDASARVLRREEADIMRRAKKEPRDASELERWLSDFYREHTEFVKRTMLPVFECLSLPGAGADKQAGFFAWRHVTASLEALREALTQAAAANADPADALQAVFDGWRDQRPQLIAAEELKEVDHYAGH